ncbi:unnamed protein product [Brassica oleracea]
MSVEELDANEKQAFLNWRRMFVRRCSHTSEIHAKAKKEVGAQSLDLVPLFSSPFYISSDVCVRFDENVDMFVVMM